MSGTGSQLAGDQCNEYNETSVYYRSQIGVAPLTRHRTFVTVLVHRVVYKHCVTTPLNSRLRRRIMIFSPGLSMRRSASAPPAPPSERGSNIIERTTPASDVYSLPNSPVVYTQLLHAMIYPLRTACFALALSAAAPLTDAGQSPRAK